MAEAIVYAARLYGLTKTDFIGSMDIEALRFEICLSRMGLQHTVKVPFIMACRQRNMDAIAFDPATHR